MYISTLMAFFISHPWRKGFYTNIPFMIVLLFIMTYSIVIIVVPKSRLKIFEVTYMDYQPLNLYILGLALGISFVIYVVQKLLLENFFNWLKNRFPENKWL